jgi:hypothetical protein
MKGKLGPLEFPLAVGELVAHFDGRPFDRDLIRFEYWEDWPPLPPGPSGAGLTKEVVEGCVICGSPPLRWSYYCERCQNFLHGQKRDNLYHVRAMKRSWDPDVDGFLCSYTGVRVDDGCRWSPWYLNFDHTTPGDRRTIVVAAAWVNRMKTALSQEEFRKVVREFHLHLRDGKGFDPHVVEFRYWKRAFMRRRRGRRIIDRD